ncbi:NADH dehydrogenase 1 alpha/beta subcomplex 1 [Exophiala viscosa]|uniref:Acyl carrier protein n=1 Tax=Exophiala viscosa TaxID=2486360 RepID=A0AAN6I8W6_9EURO|nr:NADH dehydrogenase 1 alpha/beta subcomplex 1 [Exophiala viscosa]KAI1620819.1 NADH dehydrogenase 1 alpha/beta subcomplex 1 [Exophiala viscosa]
MIRAGAVRALYAVTRTQVPRQLPAFRNQISSSLLQSSRTAPSFAITSIRCYSAPAGLSKDEVQGRIMDLLKNFDKVTDASKISGTSHFQNDLGLDSLDTVEVVMAIEEEFSIEIPDKEADAIHSVDQAVTYISNQPDAH